jgi:hypothetical protein
MRKFRDMKQRKRILFSHPQLKILSKRLHEKYIRWNLDYREREEKIKFIDNKSIKTNCRRDL